MQYPETCNPPARRLPVLDIMRAWAIFLMLIMHVFPTYARPGYSAYKGYITFFYGIEGMAAPAFMFAMGASVVLSRPRSLAASCSKALSLFLQGYLLNLLKFAPPVLLFHSFPVSLFAAIGRQPGMEGLAGFLLIGDILQFAGIAYLVVQLIRRLGPAYRIVCLLLACTVLVVAPWLYTINGHTYIAALFYGSNPLAFFPVLPWLLFPLLGLALGETIRGGNSGIKRCGVYGLAATAAGLLLICYNPVNQWGLDYYRRGSGGLLLYSGLVLCSMLAWNWLWAYFPLGLRRLIRFCSSRVTLIYGIQWVLIYWATAWVGYQQLSLYGCILALVLVAVLTLSLTWLHTRSLGLLKKRRSPLFFLKS
ncbi:heparan-alpha-glucosaminide N-acetyltransferase domain-containing protein [Taibaiella chishuiensis]|uniref:Putative membrane protein n=1 Tax=Taibaiella chishuiensis TaxID=1434707 RepID=A0A2P8D662_9BACT|nr:heparan-alpha-glucosaminide N-acetyltransferase domain-containing protein [Taibaiella chishuiensis]PSK92679.1 putative membrane protein [Taibaiella chishuiensis]